MAVSERRRRPRVQRGSGFFVTEQNRQVLVQPPEQVTPTPRAHPIIARTRSGRFGVRA